MFTLLSLTMLADTIAIVSVHSVTQNMCTVNFPYPGVNMMHFYFLRTLGPRPATKKGVYRQLTKCAPCHLVVSSLHTVTCPAAQSVSGLGGVFTQLSCQGVMRVFVQCGVWLNVLKWGRWTCTSKPAGKETRLFGRNLFLFFCIHS